MPNLYRNEASDPRDNAQRNLSGRTHYVDDDTLRWQAADPAVGFPLLQHKDGP